MAKNGEAEKEGRRASRKGEEPQARELEEILQKLREARNFDFRSYKRATLYRRVLRRMQDHGKSTLAEYSALLDSHPAEYDALLSSMFIKVTSFFRDKDTWDELSKRVIPQMLAEKRPGEEIRAWCAGCATGEEAFSLALTLAEVLGPSFANQDVKVFGTDVDEKAIAFARHAHYASDHVESVPPRLLKEWFVEENAGYTIRKDIRRCVVFGVNNVLGDAPISRLDLLLCRNVFIYLDAKMQKRVLHRFHYALRRNGILVLGKSELIPFAAKIYDTVDLSRRIYRKDGKREVDLGQERLVGLLEQETIDRTAQDVTADLGTLDQFHRDVLQSLRVPVVATSMDGAVMLWNGAASALWGRSESDVTGKKLATLNLPGLSGELLIEKSRAVRDGRSEREVSPGSVPAGDSVAARQLDVEVSILRDTGGERQGLVYVAHDMTTFREMEVEARRATDERQASFEELQTLTEEMQSSNEELETTNEELQSANEELQTTNEELQSTNEELETTNEELQSTNAELDATNRELAHRTEEINSAAYVQRTMIRSLTSAVAVLDQDGRVRIWNLAAERLLGIPEDEALGQLMWTLHIPALPRAVLQKIRKSLAQNAPLRNEQVAYELPNGSEGQAMVAAVPIVDGGAPLGAVIVIEDATRMANLAAELAALKGQNGDKRNRGA